MHDQPHPVDIHVGARMRERRREIGMSQQALGDALGISFQQVQKYERGTNRVSASVLWNAAAALRTPVAYFYEGLPGPGADETVLGARTRQFKFSEDGTRMCAAAAQLPEPVALGFTIAMEQVLKSGSLAYLAA